MSGVLTLMYYYNFVIEQSADAGIDFNIISEDSTDSFLTFEPPAVGEPLVWGPNYGRSNDSAPPHIPT
jgi:hypothetical protein